MTAILCWAAKNSLRGTKWHTVDISWFQALHPKVVGDEARRCGEPQCVLHTVLHFLFHPFRPIRWQFCFVLTNWSTRVECTLYNLSVFSTLCSTPLPPLPTNQVTVCLLLPDQSGRENIHSSWVLAAKPGKNVFCISWCMGMRNLSVFFFSSPLLLPPFC